MKKSLLAVVVGAALCLPWVAQAQESYVKFGVGQANHKVDDGRESATAFSIAFGQSLSENFGFELGYMNFGSVDSSTRSGTVLLRHKSRTQSLYAAAVATLPLAESFSVIGKLGVAANYSKFSNTTTGAPDPANNGRDSDSETKLSPMIGLGAAYNFTKQVAATVEYQYFGKVADGLKADVWTVGLKYGF